eukprot:jgi/Phyca11/14993/fgenesh1_pg.PHYCAscaffold_10_\
MSESLSLMDAPVLLFRQLHQDLLAFAGQSMTDDDAPQFMADLVSASSELLQPLSFAPPSASERSALQANTVNVAGKHVDVSPLIQQEICKLSDEFSVSEKTCFQFWLLASDQQQREWVERADQLPPSTIADNVQSAARYFLTSETEYKLHLLKELLRLRLETRLDKQPQLAQVPRMEQSVSYWHTLLADCLVFIVSSGSLAGTSPEGAVRQVSCMLQTITAVQVALMMIDVPTVADKAALAAMQSESDVAAAASGPECAQQAFHHIKQNPQQLSWDQFFAVMAKYQRLLTDAEKPTGYSALMPGVVQGVGIDGSSFNNFDLRKYEREEEKWALVNGTLAIFKKILRNADTSTTEGSLSYQLLARFLSSNPLLNKVLSILSGDGGVENLESTSTDMHLEHAFFYCLDIVKRETEAKHGSLNFVIDVSKKSSDTYLTKTTAVAALRERCVQHALEIVVLVLEKDVQFVNVDLNRQLSHRLQVEMMHTILCRHRSDFVSILNARMGGADLVDLLIDSGASADIMIGYMNQTSPPSIRAAILDMLLENLNKPAPNLAHLLLGNTLAVYLHVGLHKEPPHMKKINKLMGQMLSVSVNEHRAVARQEQMLLLQLLNECSFHISPPSVPTNQQVVALAEQVTTAVEQGCYYKWLKIDVERFCQTLQTLDLTALEEGMGDYYSSSTKRFRVNGDGTSSTSSQNSVEAAAERFIQWAVQWNIYSERIAAESHALNSLRELMEVVVLDYLALPRLQEGLETPAMWQGLDAVASNEVRLELMSGIVAAVLSSALSQEQRVRHLLTNQVVDLICRDASDGEDTLSMALAVSALESLIALEDHSSLIAIFRERGYLLHFIDIFKKLSEMDAAVFERTNGNSSMVKSSVIPEKMDATTIGTMYECFLSLFARVGETQGGAVALLEGGLNRKLFTSALKLCAGGQQSQPISVNILRELSYVTFVFRYVTQFPDMCQQTLAAAKWEKISQLILQVFLYYSADLVPPSDEIDGMSDGVSWWNNKAASSVEEQRNATVQRFSCVDCEENILEPCDATAVKSSGSASLLHLSLLDEEKLYASRMVLCNAAAFCASRMMLAVSDAGNAAPLLSITNKAQLQNSNQFPSMSSVDPRAFAAATDPLWTLAPSINEFTARFDAVVLALETSKQLAAALMTFKNEAATARSISVTSASSQQRSLRRREHQCETSPLESVLEYHADSLTFVVENMLVVLLLHFAHYLSHSEVASSRSVVQHTLGKVLAIVSDIENNPFIHAIARRLRELASSS